MNKTTEIIIEEVCKAYGTTKQEITSKSRKQPIPEARQIVFILCYAYLKDSMTVKEIARQIGNFTHSIIYSSKIKVNDLRSIDLRYKKRLDKIKLSCKKRM